MAPPGPAPSALETTSTQVALNRDVRSRTPQVITMPEVASAGSGGSAIPKEDDVSHAPDNLTPWWMQNAGAGRA